MAEMACKLVDELRYEYNEGESTYTIYYETYDMHRTEDDLWRALWILERDVRVTQGAKWPREHERELTWEYDIEDLDIESEV